MEGWGKPEALYIMELPWAGMWPSASGSRDELCNHTGEGWVQGQTHKSTDPEKMPIQNASY